MQQTVFFAKQSKTRMNNLVGGLPTPLKNMLLGMMKLPIHGITKNVPNHQPATHLGMVYK